MCLVKKSTHVAQIDGAWPASALDDTTTPPSYIYDSDPTVYSRLTLLIYLNDDFDGGCTTFFLPSPNSGVLEARPVKPRAGTVCIFPHGATAGSLLHEVRVSTTAHNTCLIYIYLREAESRLARSMLYAQKSCMKSTRAKEWMLLRKPKTRPNLPLALVNIAHYIYYACSSDLIQQIKSLVVGGYFQVRACRSTRCHHLPLS